MQQRALVFRGEVHHIAGMRGMDAIIRERYGAGAHGDRRGAQVYNGAAPVQNGRLVDFRAAVGAAMSA